MTNAFYHKFLKRWEDVIDLPPTNLGRATPYYKMISRRLKVMPWPVLVIGSLFLVIGIYFFIGPTITFIVSILQKGF